MDILKGKRKLALAILGIATAVVTALVGDISSLEMVDAIVKIVGIFIVGNGVEHVAGIFGKKE